jgi:putative phosphoesterase
VKVGIVSDIHCNHESLRQALDIMHDCDAFFCAGDAVFGHRFSNEVYDLLRGREMFTVLGNHDWDFLTVRRQRNGANGFVSPENARFLEQLPWRLEVELGGRRILMTHGSPFHPSPEYLYRRNPAFKRLGTLDCDVFIYGHTHEPVVEQVGNVLVINPGSAGVRYNASAAPMSCVTLDLASGEATLHTIGG